MSAGVDSTLGVLFLGNLAAAVLYGMTCVQTFSYYQLFDKDRRTLKLAVLSLWTLDSIHIAMVSHAVYTYAVSDFGNADALNSPVWSIWVQAIISTISDIGVRLIYGIRIWTLSNKNVYLATAIALSILIIIGSSLAVAAKCFDFSSYEDVISNSYLLYLCLGSEAVADAIIASSLCVLLFKNRTYTRRTNSLVNTLLLYTICTGMLTGLYMIILIALYAIFPNNSALPQNSVFIAVYFPASKMYLNALLANLNARSKLREEFNGRGRTVALDALQFEFPATSTTGTSSKVHIEGGLAGARMPHESTIDTINQRPIIGLTKRERGRSF
ncbi:hypothetical protein PILCRDRAFT_828212 [Piloderma croceum F 1598]|uniref:DUF6534 domain-containing protein n=1 Tax=Piloderma croceum (strain F 1598) TaxID=765440 RepID=A0A0C3F372_PILCF|nr:hypothetical protein PILCRDRAFT_828212 [Piloderma croceum F 1598]